MGWGRPSTGGGVVTDAGEVRRVLHDLSLPVFVVKQAGEAGWGVATGGNVRFGEESGEGLPVIGYGAGMRVSQLGGFFRFVRIMG